MPIVVAPLDQDLKIIKILINEKTRKHLETLGIIVNGTLRVISNHKGDVVVVVKNVRLALNREVASKIFVM